MAPGFIYTGTDYVTPCGTTPLTFYQLLELCMVENDGRYILNTIVGYGNCSGLDDFWTCDNNHLDPERALCENLFAYDDCGHLAIKLFGASRLIGGLPS